MQSPRYEDLGHIPYEGFCYVVSVVYLILRPPGRCTFLGFPGSTIDSMHGTGQNIQQYAYSPEHLASKSGSVGVRGSWFIGSNLSWLS